MSFFYSSRDNLRIRAWDAAEKTMFYFVQKEGVFIGTDLDENIVERGMEEVMLDDHKYLKMSGVWPHARLVTGQAVYERDIIIFISNSDIPEELKRIYCVGRVEYNQGSGCFELNNVQPIVTYGFGCKKYSIPLSRTGNILCVIGNDYEGSVQLPKQRRRDKDEQH